MRRLFTTTALLTALALSPVVSADAYVNEAKQFEVTIPTGWTHAAGDGGAIDLVLASPRVKETMGLCVLISRDIADTRKDSQAKINEEAGKEITDDFWRAIMTDKDTKVTSVASKSEMKNGRRVFFGTVGVTSTFEGKEVNLQTDMVLHLMPGKAMMGQCGVEIAQLDLEKADIQTVISSYNSTGAGVVASADPHNHGTHAKLSNTLTEALAAGAKDMISRMGKPR
jgi:hypothetical protein